MKKNNKRTQLNINISPSLLNYLKTQSIQLGKPLGIFINDILYKYINEIEHSYSNEEKVEERINFLETQIESINTTLLVKEKTIESESENIAKDLVKNYYLEVQNIFTSESKQKDISSREFYYLLSQKVQSKGLNLNYELIMDIFRGQIIPSVTDVKKAFSFRGYLDCYKFLINSEINLPKSFLDQYDLLFEKV